MFVIDKIMDEESKDLWRKKIMPYIFLNLEPSASTDPIFDV